MCYTLSIPVKPKTKHRNADLQPRNPLQKYYKMLIWQDKEEFYSDKINKNKSSLFNVAIRNAFSTKQTAERNCRKAASFRLNHSFFPRIIHSKHSVPFFPSRISPVPSHVPPILKYGVGDLDGGTVGVLCFIFRFKALSHNRNISWDRDRYLSQGIFKRIWQLQYHNQNHWER